MMEPTIGRVVHLYLNGARPKTWNGQNVAQLPAADHFIALVSYVHPRKPEAEHEINVAAFDHFGQPFTVNGIPLVAPDTQMPPNGMPFARWMPYQVSKAARGDHNSESAEPRPCQTAMRVDAIETLVHRLCKRVGPLDAEDRPDADPLAPTAGDLAREELASPPIPANRCVMIERATGQRCNGAGVHYSARVDGWLCERHASPAQAEHTTVSPQLVPEDQPEGEDAPT